ncbi:MAG: hypothetical protein ABI035_02035 [Gemmatimonadaceae bacterium]
MISEHSIGGAQRGGTRKIVLSRWDTVYQFSAAGPQYAQHVAITHSGIDYIDASADSVVSVDWKMKSRWRASLRFAADTQAPFPVELAASSDDRAWVLDGKTRAIKRVGGAGVPVSIKAVTNADGIAAFGFDTLLVLSDSSASPVLLVAGSGGVIRGFALPWTFYGRLDALARATDLTTDSRGNWAVGFVYGDGWTVSSTTGRRYTGVYVEATKFPDLLQFDSSNGITTEVLRSTRSAISIAVDGDKLYVLFAGSTLDRDRLIDEYDVPTATYLHSYVLPERAGRIMAVEGAVFAIGRTRPLRILRLRLATGAAGTK